MTDPINLWDVLAYGLLGWSLGVLTCVAYLSMKDRH
jgi:hypothetical protein